MVRWPGGSDAAEQGPSREERVSASHPGLPLGAGDSLQSLVLSLQRTGLLQPERAVAVGCRSLQGAERRSGHTIWGGSLSVVTWVRRRVSVAASGDGEQRRPTAP